MIPLQFGSENENKEKIKRIYKIWRQPPPHLVWQQYVDAIDNVLENYAIGEETAAQKQLYDLKDEFMGMVKYWR